MSDANVRIETALGAMTLRPRSLRAYLEKPGPDFESASAADMDNMMGLILSANPNEPARVRFSNLLRSWDNAKNMEWTQTARNTAARRKQIHELLKSTSEDEQRIDSLLPFYNLEEPLIVSEKHQDWYEPKPGIRDYYWSKYEQYLREKRHWNDVSILTIDNSTRAIVECLGNPESPAAYASRGLVMGYVQSGKTANFAGVVARAADAGYRLIIVLAGTWNILRNQTQRRLDKELLGKELLKNDETYTKQPPSDWDEFLEHGADPVELGHYAWQRLTRPDIDLRRLKAAIDSLEFERKNKAAPLYDPSNLHMLPVKLLVIKKHAGILSGLIKDLALLRTALKELPVLIIDDESDQAGLNTADPGQTGSKRPPTNESIVELLKLFPRGQYVGYTATPYANALVNPDDTEDLYPKDFIVSLDRPPEYMGVSDFFDPMSDYEDLDRKDFSQPEIAYIRRVENAPDDDDDDLQKALRSYVLAGGIKLFRNALKPQQYKSEYFRHHTMLVHTSTSTGAHVSTANRVEELWLKCAFNSPKGLRDLEDLWETDYREVSQAIGKEELPASFSELRPHLAQAIKQIEEGNRILRVVNSDTNEAPDFSAGPVWKIVVGGNKLSRGYTVEGLTVSYYRRVSSTADTLMQMGRWFGFRPGHRDLVRVFLGVREGRKRDTDLVALFKDVCKMEERFREEIKRYIRKEGSERITPKDIPPLIAISGSLPPTARNKMFNAVVKNKNFGGRRSMLTMTPDKPTRQKANVEAVRDLLKAAEALGRKTLGGTLSDGKHFDTDAFVFSSSNDSLTRFLSSYRWLETEYKEESARPADVNLQIEFLKKEKHEISSWLIVAPQRNKSFGKPVSFAGVAELTVKLRSRDPSSRRFQVFGEPPHRDVADYLAGISQKNFKTPNSATKNLKSEHMGVLLLYPVREKENDQVSMGYELFFPPNSMQFDTGFTVRRRTEQIVVESAS